MQMKTNFHMNKRAPGLALKNSEMVHFNGLFSVSPLVDRNIFTDEHLPFGYFPPTGTMG